MYHHYHIAAWHRWRYRLTGKRWHLMLARWCEEDCDNDNDFPYIDHDF